MANGLQNNMPKFYCDYRNTYLTCDSPSVRKTHCSGRKHRETVKDYCQKWMEEQAQSLVDKTTVASQQEEIPPTLRSAPPPAGAMIPPPPSLLGPPRSGLMPALHIGGPSHDANDGSSSSWDNACGTCFWNEATYGRAHANDSWVPSDETSCPSHDGAHSARNDLTRQIRRKGSLFLSVFCDLF